MTAVDIAVGTARLLLVDDDEPACRLLSEILERDIPGSRRTIR